MTKRRTARQRAASRRNLEKARRRKRNRRAAVTVAGVALAAGGTYAGKRFHNHLMRPMSLGDLKGTGKFRGSFEEIDPRSFKRFKQRAGYQARVRKLQGRRRR